MKTNDKPKTKAIKCQFVVTCAGDSLWANRTGKFTVVNGSLQHGGFFTDSNSGSLTLFGNGLPWDAYTDNGIERDVFEALKGKLKLSKLTWSEQGMQNNDAWNFDVKFL